MTAKIKHSGKKTGGPAPGASLGHLALLASAGSGKTTRLCRRYIQLLAGKDAAVTPSRICALTFTRKAAGEIFDRIVADLCGAAAGQKEAAKLAGDLAMPGLNERDFARLLRQFLDHLHRAVIGTMDSFVVGVAKSFPIELGIPVDFKVADADDAEARAMRQDILAGLLAAPGAGRGELLEAFKRATFGVEEKSFERFLNNVVAALHLSYRCCPNPAKWGNANLVWPAPHGINLRIHGRAELAKQADAVGRWIGKHLNGKAINANFLESLLEISAALAAHDLAAPWNRKLAGVIFDQLMKNRAAPGRAGAVLTYRNKDISLPPNAAGALAVLVDNLVAVEIRRALEKTRGLRDLLELYDRAYEKVSRETGCFSFTDIQYMLAPGELARDVRPISRSREANRLFIDYRMDSRLDHWLLDEFQDTSDLQWAIFKNLVSELVQGDPQGQTRSFFYVGDVKQSIYRWRGGNPGLFLDIQNQFNRAGEVIRTETMAATYRCSKPVIDAVNEVFAELPAGKLPAATIAAWKAVWSRHTTLNEQAPGHAALLEHANTDEPPEEARYRLVADLLNEIQPAKRGIAVGILTRTNEACSALVNILRRECPGIGFVHEGKFGIVQNELAQALLALVRLAAHPGDNYAWQHVRMSPLNRVLDDLRVTRDTIAPFLLAEIERSGFHAFMAGWGGRLGRVCALNEYGRQCLARLEKAAAEFDAAGSRSCNRFLQFAGGYEIHEKAARGSVRIMTIHQAKGLGFDMVVLPQLQQRAKMNMARAEWTDKEMLYGGKPFNPAWVLKSPKMDVAENDPVLGARLRKIDADHCFDSLCLLYVAMTRAKNALYMIASPTRPSTAFRPADLLKLRLAGTAPPAAGAKITINNREYVRLYSSNGGTEKWHEAFPVMPVPAKVAGPAAAGRAGISGRASRRQVLRRSEPSRQDDYERNAADLFKPERRDVLDFGSAIHELFEKIEWLDAGMDADAIIGSWRPSRPCDRQVREDVLFQFRKCLQSREVLEALARPAGNVELWREKSFEIILADQWVSGVFDRVVIARDASAKPIGAAIIDFKSNRGLDSEARLRATAGHYRPQMELYRRALAQILDLAAERIAARLLFTVPARVVGI